MHNLQTIKIEDLQVGDTVSVDGEWQTITRVNMPKKDELFGYSFLGRYTKEVDVVLFPKWYKGEVQAMVRRI